MGEVFRGVHVDHDFPVALKILNAERARDPEFRTALRREIRAVARLYHPGIIMVFDCGEVSEDIEFDTRGRFVAGSSWFAMELATFSLEDVDRSRIDWWHVRNIFVRILDALSHSHARGVVHRDLKPGNVLFVQGEDGRHLKLTDFGLAHALEDSPEEDGLTRKITGTPRFMSPEQITGRWRDHGPWTDLYALGCMAYWLIGGEPPYCFDDTDQILEAHLQDRLPPLHASFDVPPDFGTWLGRLLAKNPADRFQRAADAARALFALGTPPGSRRPDDHPRLEFTATLDESTAPVAPDTDMGITEIISDVVASPSVPELQALERPRNTPIGLEAPGDFQIPRHWHRQQPPQLSADLIGVGLGLFGLRQIPFVDRDAERNKLWDALRKTASTRTPHLILLEGATGTGKTRLANWICERAHELGAATPLYASHSPMGGSHEGLGAMFARHLRCNGLERDQLLERTRQRLRSRDLDPDALHDCLAMTEIIAPAVIEDYREDDARIRFQSPRERYSVIFRYLERLGRHRPLILFLDDLQWGHDALNAMEYLLESPQDRSLPLLVIATLQKDALVDRPAAREKIGHLKAHERSESISVGPLASDDHRLLVERILGLEEDLVDQVAERTGGNPLYAVQLVEDWVQRGVLELGEKGFRLRSGEEAPLPADLQEVFLDRLKKLVGQDLDDEPSDALLALELAAVLGTEVRRAEWSTVCTGQNIRLPLLIVESMMTNDLATLTSGGWSFTHQAFRDTLLHIAEKCDRLSDHHVQCARALESVYPEDHPGLAIRLARHYLAAKEYELAVEPLLRAMSQCRIRCDFELGNEIYRHYERSLDELGAGDDDLQRVRGWIEKARTLNRLQKTTEADELLARAEEVAHRHDEPNLRADALLRRADVANSRGDLTAGMRYIEEALHLFQLAGNAHGRALSLSTLADLHYWAGDYHDAERAYLRSVKLFSSLDHPLDLARAEQALGTLYTVLDDTDRARELLEDARRVFEEHGDFRDVAQCLNNLGETYRKDGRLEEAEQAYNESDELRRRTGLGDSPVVLLNLGLVRLERNRIDEADPLFERVLDLLADSDRPAYIGLAHLARLPAMAHHRDWERWDHHLRRAKHYLDTTGFVDADLAALAQNAGQRALKADQPERARAALFVARKQWLSMGRQDRAAHIDRIMPD